MSCLPDVISLPPCIHLSSICPPFTDSYLQHLKIILLFFSWRIPPVAASKFGLKRLPVGSFATLLLVPTVLPCLLFIFWLVLWCNERPGCQSLFHPRMNAFKVTSSKHNTTPPPQYLSFWLAVWHGFGRVGYYSSALSKLYGFVLKNACGRKIE